MKKFLAIFITVLLFCTFSINVCALDTSAKSAIVINGLSGSVIYSKNSDVKLPMASTTKIMTALILVEQNTPEKQVTVTDKMVRTEGSSMGLKVGDTVTYNDLLYGMMLSSGNDAANAAALSIGGSFEGFADIMNDKAAQLGLKNTNFVTPSGLNSDEHYTTAYDLAILTMYALRNSQFKKVCSTKEKTLCYGTPPVKHTLSNHNRILSLYDGAVGVKTGFTKAAGRCLVTAAQRENTQIIAVTLNDGNDWKDHINMLDYGFNNTVDQVIDPILPGRISVIGSDKDSMELYTESRTFGISAGDEITYKINLPSIVYPDIVENDILGSVDYYCNGDFISSAPITAKNGCTAVTDNMSMIEKILKKFMILFRSI